MLRKIPTSLLLAAFVTSSLPLAARTVNAQAKPAAPQAKPAAAPLAPADAAPLMGTWQIPLETPTGRLVADLTFRNEGGKVVAGVSAPQFPEHKITDTPRPARW